MEVCLSPDPRSPVIVGTSQVSQWPEDHTDPIMADDAVALMSRAVTAAAEDAGVRDLTRSIQLTAVVAGLWRHVDPGRLVADELGIGSPLTMRTSFGGQIPVSLTNHLATEIAAGRLDMAVIVGGEATVTRHRLREVGLKPAIRDEPTDGEVTPWGPALEMGDDVALQRGAALPVNSYAILDSSIRARRGFSIADARGRAADTWEQYARVAADNPHASERSSPDSATIRRATPSNRMVSWPYTKAMCANNIVDRAGAVIICSTAEADRLGIAPDRRIYPHVGIDSSDAPHLLTRDRIDSVPGLHALAEALRDRIGDVDRLSHHDIYACFPSIVELTSEVLGLRSSFVPTVTGGLAFAGAPMNYAAGQSLAAMAHMLRDDPGSLGMVHGNGGHAAKHAVSVLSTMPPTDEYAEINCGTHPGPRLEAHPDAVSDVVIDGFTVEHSRSGPTRAIAACRLPDGSRTWATSTESDLITTFLDNECVGLSGRVSAGQLEV